MLAMSMQTHTPVGYWADMPIWDFLEWAEVCVELLEEMSENAKREVDLSGR